LLAFSCATSLQIEAQAMQGNKHACWAGIPGGVEFVVFFIRVFMSVIACACFLMNTCFVVDLVPRTIYIPLCIVVLVRCSASIHSDIAELSSFRTIDDALDKWTFPCMLVCRVDGELVYEFVSLPGFI